MDREKQFENWIDEIFQAAYAFDDELYDSEYYEVAHEVAHEVFEAIERASMMLNRE